MPQRSGIAPRLARSRHGRGPCHHVNIGIPRRSLALFGGDLEGRGDADIERISRRDPCLHQRQQRRLGLLGEVGNGGALGLRIVVKQIDRCSRVGHEADARPFRRPAAFERERGFDKIVERAVIDDAVTLAHGEIGGVVAGDGAGVRLRGGLRLHRGAGLDGKDRFAQGKRAARRVHERLRAANAFDEEDDLARVRVVDDEIEIIGKAEIRLVARRDAIGVAKPPLGRSFHPELQQPAGLEDAGDRTRRKPAQVRVGIAEQALAIGVSAHAVRTGYPQAALRRELLEPGSACLRLRRVAVAQH